MMDNKITLNSSPVIFKEDTHQYFLGETELQGITSTLIKRAFPDKYKDIDPEVLAEAARKGHELHTAIEFYDNFGGDPEKAADDRIGLYAGMKERDCMVTVANEYLVSDNEHYASSIDIVMTDGNGDICLVDIKTTWKLDKASTGLQLSIYKRFFEEQNPHLHVSHIYALWLPNKDHSKCVFEELSLVPDETIDALIEADLNDKPFHFELIPDEWSDLERSYKFWLEKKENAEQHLEDIKQKMMDVMQTCNLQAVKTDLMTVSYIPPKKSQRFDSALFRKENGDLYKSYMKDTETTASIRVLPKKKNEEN